MTIKTLKAAVIGVGYLGHFHAQKYAQLDGVELIAVVDTDSRRADEVAAKVGARAETDFKAILGDVDLVSIVVPPARHFPIAHACLSAGVHALVEKPLTETVDQAQTLIEVARREDLALQVGHLERFNPVTSWLHEQVGVPTRFEAQRFAPFMLREGCCDTRLAESSATHPFSNSSLAWAISISVVTTAVPEQCI